MELTDGLRANYIILQIMLQSCNRNEEIENYFIDKMDAGDKKFN